jgi:hypothetical protein
MLKKSPYGKSFVCGKDNVQLSRMLEDAYVFLKRDTEEVVVIDLDGSSHDAHQHREYIEAVDNQFLEANLRRIFDAAELPYHWFHRVKKVLSDTTAKVIAKNKKELVLSGVIQGTTFSGHPTRTTFGNSLRVMTYVRFAMSLGRISNDDFRLFVSGDDVLLLLKKQVAQPALKSLRRVYTEEQAYVQHGLGLLSGNLSIKALFSPEFLSREIFFFKELGFLINRGFIKQLFGSTQQNSAVSTLTTDQYRTLVTQCNLRGGMVPENTALEDLFKTRAELDLAVLDERRLARYRIEERVDYWGGSTNTPYWDSLLPIKYPNFRLLIDEAISLYRDNDPIVDKEFICGDENYTPTNLLYKSENRSTMYKRKGSKNGANAVRKAAKKIVQKTKTAISRVVKNNASRKRNVGNSGGNGQHNNGNVKRNVEVLENHSFLKAKKYLEWFEDPFYPRRSLVGSDDNTSCALYKYRHVFTPTNGRLAIKWDPNRFGNLASADWGRYNPSLSTAFDTDSSVFNSTSNALLPGNVNLPANNGIRVLHSHVLVEAVSSTLYTQGQIIANILPEKNSTSMTQWNQSVSDMLNVPRMSIAVPVAEGLWMRAPPERNENLGITVFSPDVQMANSYCIYVSGASESSPYTSIAVTFFIAFEWIPVTTTFLYAPNQVDGDPIAYNYFLTENSKLKRVGSLKSAACGFMGGVRALMPHSQNLPNMTDMLLVNNGQQRKKQLMKDLEEIISRLIMGSILRKSLELLLSRLRANFDNEMDVVMGQPPDDDDHGPDMGWRELLELNPDQVLERLIHEVEVNPLILNDRRDEPPSSDGLIAVPDPIYPSSVVQDNGVTTITYQGKSLDYNAAPLSWKIGADKLLARDAYEVVAGKKHLEKEFLDDSRKRYTDAAHRANMVGGLGVGAILGGAAGLIKGS